MYLIVNWVNVKTSVRFFFLKYLQCLNVIPVFEISSSLVSKKTEEGNGGLTEDCSPGGPDLPDFWGDVDPIESK